MHTMTKDHSTRDWAAHLLASPSGSAESWKALPEVIRALFAASGQLSVHDSLQALDVPVPGGTIIERVYESTRGPLVVTVWHDQIERDAEGALTCWIDGYGWRPDGEGPQDDHNAEVRRLLNKYAGRDVYALLLKRGWSAAGEPFVESSAPDIVMWMLESAGQQWFVLRRPTVKRSDSKRGA